VRLLIAEDEERLSRPLHQAAAEVGWQPTVVADGPGAVRAVSEGGVDVLLLDWMLPGMDGPAVIEALRRAGHRTPVLMLTARGGVDDRVHGLTVGADDYLAKPFELAELIARLRALHRRARPDAVVAFRAGDLVVDHSEHRVSRGDHEITLSAREFDVLRVLVDHVGRYVSRYTILDEAWDGDTDISSNVIDVHIGRLRAKIDTPFGRSAIQTLRGVGYRLDPAGG
jgi:two-component system OmpR family response regulator